MNDTPPQDVDLGGSEPSADPLADVPAESEFDQPEPDALPPGVEQGELGGFNPSEDPEPDPLAEPTDEPEPTPVGEPEGDPSETGSDLDRGAEVQGDLDEPEPPDMHQSATDESAASEPRIDDVPPEVTEEPTPEEAEPLAEPEPQPEPETPVATTGQGAGAEPDAEAAKPKRRSPRRKRAKELPEGVREYVPFRQVNAGLNLTAENLIELAEAGKLWIEEKPVDSRSGEYALRKTFRNLSEDDAESSFTLAAVPSKLWSPKEVKAQRRAQTSISIG